MSARILVVDDEQRYRDLYAQVLTSAGLYVEGAASAELAAERLQAAAFDMVVCDVNLPGRNGVEFLASVREQGAAVPFLLVTAYADVRDAVAALKLGAVDYLSKPIDLDELVACVCDTLGLALGTTSEDPSADLLGPMVVHSPIMRSVMRDAWRIAESEVNVLVTGESGTGKELIAGFIHRASPRASGPLVALNCAALPGSLLASELFGHVRGAFTGATSARKGRFREAEGGVLFLDEIGDMPLDLQPVFLRALEQRVIAPVGSTGDVPVDFRLVAATNRDLESEVAAGRFRADLFYRLNVITLDVPSLRERVDDILPLARAFLNADDGPNKRIARATARVLRSYPWPGNVRELQNAMRRARLLARTELILPENLPPAVRAAEGNASAAVAGTSSVAQLASPEDIATLQEVEIASLKRALAATDGNRTHAAELLGISRRGLLKKLKRFDLSGDA